MGKMTRNDQSQGSLYIVATPIGNLRDITLRALDTLKAVDYVAVEDTRVSGRLFSTYEINTRKVSYFEHNEKTRGPAIIKDLLEGKSVALITDAGTPLISDPGYLLVNLALQNDIDVIPVPGPSSLLAALCASGFPAHSFCFEGYPPKSGGKLRRFFENLKDEIRTIILFESPHRIKKCLSAMLEVLGDREIFIGRELTKKFEERIHGTVSQILDKFEKTPPKGEMVIVIRGKQE
jgi:16S rRNA (cytidine1402-2'-O)-methyltransferase